MSDVSAEEKRRLLRERRLAKMQQGKATERLNNILNQGSSTGHASVVSVLEKPNNEATPETTDFRSETPLHDDPEVPDISLLLQQDAPDFDSSEQDMDAMLNKILGAASGNSSANSESGEGMSNQFTDMMRAMMESGPESAQDGSTSSYQNELSSYHAYEQKQWKARFLIVRLLLHFANFYYHFANYASFRAHLMGRLLGLSGLRSNFFTIFLSMELVVISCYFAVLSQQGLLQAFSRNHILSKIQSMAAAFVPLVAKYRPMVDTALVYWGGVSIFIEDLMLVVFLLGLTSLIGVHN